MSEPAEEVEPPLPRFAVKKTTGRWVNGNGLIFNVFTLLLGAFSLCLTLPFLLNIAPRPGRLWMFHPGMLIFEALLLIAGRLLIASSVQGFVQSFPPRNEESGCATDT